MFACRFELCGSREPHLPLYVDIDAILVPPAPFLGLNYLQHRRSVIYTARPFYLSLAKQYVFPSFC